LANLLDFLLCPLEIALDFSGSLDAVGELRLHGSKSLLSQRLQFHQLTSLVVKLAGTARGLDEDHLNSESEERETHV
jgi:hypothetical protein